MEEINLMSVAVALIILVAIMVIINAVVKKTPARQLMNQLRPVVIEALQEILELREAKEKGREALEDYAVELIYERIVDSKILSEEELEILNKDFIRTLVKPHLKKLK